DGTRLRPAGGPLWSWLDRQRCSVTSRLSRSGACRSRRQGKFGPGRRIRVPGIVGHRVAGFSPESPAARIRRGVAVTSWEWALVDSWPMLVADAQRAPLLCAVGERLTTTARVRDAVRARYRLPQRAALLRLLDRLDAGCRSPLELRDYDHV